MFSSIVTSKSIGIPVLFGIISLSPESKSTILIDSWEDIMTLGIGFTSSEEAETTSEYCPNPASVNART